MTIKDYNKFYGCVLSYLIESFSMPLSFQKIDCGTKGFFLVQQSQPLYIKYSTSRRGPWVFNFNREHSSSLLETVEKFGGCAVALVCGSDGIAGMAHQDLHTVIPLDSGQQEAVSVRRKLREMYSVSGPKGNLPSKLGRDSLSELLALSLN